MLNRLSGDFLLNRADDGFYIIIIFYIIILCNSMQYANAYFSHSCQLWPDIVSWQHYTTNPQAGTQQPAAKQTLDGPHELARSGKVSLLSYLSLHALS